MNIITGILYYLTFILFGLIPTLFAVGLLTFVIGLQNVAIALWILAGISPILGIISWFTSFKLMDIEVDKQQKKDVRATRLTI